MTRQITDEDKHAEAVREVSMRHGVYPRFVSAGRMTQEEADRKIAILQSVVDDYDAKLNPLLFSTGR
jgi:hypothetical protein